MSDRPGDGPPEKLAPRAVVGRVSLYLRQFEAFAKEGHETVSSNVLGKALGINGAQVRKDLAFFGQFGYPGVGYRIGEMVPAIRRILGIDQPWPTAIVGLGNLGRALLKYRGFRGRGFRIVGLFDNDPRKQGQQHGGLPIRPISELRPAIDALGIRLAILTVPAEGAQDVADLLVAGGVRGILNFAPATLNVPDSVNVVAVDLSIQLEHLAYRVQYTDEGDPAGE